MSKEPPKITFITVRLSSLVFKSKLQISGDDTTKEESLLATAMHPLPISNRFKAAQGFHTDLFSFLHVTALCLHNDVLNESLLPNTVIRKGTAGSPDGLLVYVWKSAGSAHEGIYQSRCIASRPAGKLSGPVLCLVRWREIQRSCLQGAQEWRLVLLPLTTGDPSSSSVLRMHHNSVTSSSVPSSLVSLRVSHISYPQLSSLSVFSPQLWVIPSLAHASVLFQI